MSRSRQRAMVILAILVPILLAQGGPAGEKIDGYDWKEWNTIIQKKIQEISGLYKEIEQNKVKLEKLKQKFQQVLEKPKGADSYKINQIAKYDFNDFYIDKENGNEVYVIRLENLETVEREQYPMFFERVIRLEFAGGTLKGITIITDKTPHFTPYRKEYRKIEINVQNFMETKLSSRVNLYSYTTTFKEMRPDEQNQIIDHIKANIADVLKKLVQMVKQYEVIIRRDNRNQGREFVRRYDSSGLIINNNNNVDVR